ncbi:unknown [Megasphaera elsdenii CAG:570]|uniref:Uncharacterized protein n=1 Tax=Megasphaera elsdenii CAG:570 TaxID=1263087 RepID=R7N025_MEGEL|nr:unknown [Megasphaera elsdenii CAG:570]
MSSSICLSFRAFLRKLSRFSTTFFSVMAIHWKGVKGLGMKGLMLRVMRLRLPMAAMCCWTRRVMSTMPCISSSVSMGRPTMMYMRTWRMPAAVARSMDWSRCSSVMPLLMMSRMCLLPASGARVIVFWPLSASPLTIVGVIESARKDAQEKARPWSRMKVTSSSM